MKVTPILFNWLKPFYECAASLFARALRRPARWSRWQWHRSVYAGKPSHARCPLCPFPPSPGVFHLDSLADPHSATLRHGGALFLARKRQDKSSLRHRGTRPCRYLCPPPPRSLFVQMPAASPTSNGVLPSALKPSMPFG